MPRKNPVLLRSGGSLASGRKERGLTQAQAAELITDLMRRYYADLDVGDVEVTPEQYAAWERDDNEIPSRYVRAVAEALGCDPLDLLSIPKPRAFSIQAEKIARIYDAVGRDYLRESMMKHAMAMLDTEQALNRAKEPKKTESSKQ